jgi:hypothetical protein
MPVNLSTDNQLTRAPHPYWNSYTMFLHPPLWEDVEELFFVNGVWRLGLFEGEILELGTKIVIYMATLKQGWQRRNDGYLVESALVDVESEQAPPRREDLGDRDESSWDIGKSGRPQDPWERVVRFSCSIIGDDRRLSFNGNTPSARDTIARVCKEYGQITVDHPEVRPIVELSCRADPNDWSINITPRFRLIGWDGAEQLADDGTPLPTAEAPDIPAPKTGKTA